MAVQKQLKEQTVIQQLNLCYEKATNEATMTKSRTSKNS